MVIVVKIFSLKSNIISEKFLYVCLSLFFLNVMANKEKKKQKKKKPTATKKTVQTKREKKKGNKCQKKFRVCMCFSIRSG